MQEWLARNEKSRPIPTPVRPLEASRPSAHQPQVAGNVGAGAEVGESHHYRESISNAPLTCGYATPDESDSDVDMEKLNFNEDGIVQPPEVEVPKADSNVGLSPRDLPKPPVAVATPGPVDPGHRPSKNPLVAVKKEVDLVPRPSTKKVVAVATEVEPTASYGGHIPTTPEPFLDQDGILLSGVPSIMDQQAPKPQLQVHDISPAAIRQRANRIFTPRVDGTLKVSKVIFDEWKGKGKERKLLEQIFRQCGYSPESCL